MENNTEVKFSLWVQKKFQTSNIFEHENGEKIALWGKIIK
jgi:hypothetical protein